jgi:hypothetical protein
LIRRAAFILFTINWQSARLVEVGFYKKPSITEVVLILLLNVLNHFPKFQNQNPVKSFLFQINNRGVIKPIKPIVTF